MAGGPKTCFALSIPITSAASETSNMNGHMIRVSKIVSAVLSGDQLPHVNRSTSCGANRIPTSVTALMKTAVSVATLFASRHADSSPSTAIFCENVVMKAVDSAPSANKSRSKFGNRNAIRNASRFFPAPNRPANAISRIKPSTRLHRIAMPTTPVARVLLRRSSAAIIGEQRTASVNLRKKKLPEHHRIRISSLGRVVALRRFSKTNGAEQSVKILAKVPLLMRSRTTLAATTTQPTVMELSITTPPATIRPSVLLRCLTTSAPKTRPSVIGLFSNAGPVNNTAVGFEALSSNFTGNLNTANGASALAANTTGAGNTANGAEALSSNTDGSENTANGLDALQLNTTGDRNTAIGLDAGRNQTTGSDNVYIGQGMGGVVGESNACYIKSIFGQTSASGIPVLINSDNKLRYGHFLKAFQGGE